MEILKAVNALASSFGRRRISMSFLKKAKYDAHPHEHPPHDPHRDPKFLKLRENMAHFQKDDGKPIHLKGHHDKKTVMAYYALLYLGMFETGRFHYSLIFPKKPGEC